MNIKALLPKTELWVYFLYSTSSGRLSKKYFVGSRSAASWPNKAHSARQEVDL